MSIDIDFHNYAVRRSPPEMVQAAQAKGPGVRGLSASSTPCK